jgi:hypothetical protein
MAGGWYGGDIIGDGWLGGGEGVAAGTCICGGVRRVQPGLARRTLNGDRHGDTFGAESGCGMN